MYFENVLQKLIFYTGFIRQRKIHKQPYVLPQNHIYYGDYWWRTSLSNQDIKNLIDKYSWWSLKSHFPMECTSTEVDKKLRVLIRWKTIECGCLKFFFAFHLSNKAVFQLLKILSHITYHFVNIFNFSF